MENISFEQKIRSIDWGKYLGSKYYDSKEMSFSPERLVNVLIRLTNNRKSTSAPNLGRDVLEALGNYHRGTFYPAALEVITLLIEIEKRCENTDSRTIAKAILNDLNYFRLEIGTNDKEFYDSINNTIREKLIPYSDEFMKPV